MSRAASYSTISGQPRTFAIAGSLLLVSVSYVLLLSAPLITRHLRSVVSNVGGVKSFEWLPLACGAGLVLGGASALVFVLTQIAREAERRPYVCMAPVLAAFAACILIGLRADLPLKGVASEQLAVFGLALSVIGGSLVQTPRVTAQMMGLGFTFLPPLSLFVVLWALSGKTDPAHAIWALSAPARAFLGMLTLSSFAIAGVATLGRRPEPLSARLPRESERYVLYELEEDLSADEARLRQRGLPGWAIGLAAAAAVALGFMALKVFLERRAALNLLAPSAPASAPVSSAPAAEQAAVVGPEAPAVHVEPVAPSGAEPATPALVIEARGAAREQNHEQPVREQIAPQPSAPELARQQSREQSKTTAVAAPKPVRSRGARVEHKPVPVAVVAPARSEKPAPRSAHAASAKLVQAKPVLEAKPAAEPKKAAPKAPLSVADLAVQAASVAAQHAKPKAGASETKAPAQDDSLDALMDNVLKGGDKGGKKQRASDDPIYGL